MAGTNKTSVASYRFYDEDTTPVAGAFTDLELDFVDLTTNKPFTSGTIAIFNDNSLGGDYIEWSFDGTAVHGKILPQEKLIFDNTREQQIYLRSPGASDYRFWAY